MKLQHLIKFMNCFNGLTYKHIGKFPIMPNKIRIGSFLIEFDDFYKHFTAMSQSQNPKSEISTENISLENIYRIKLLKLIYLKFYPIN